MPQSEELEELGLDESEIEEIQETFSVRKRVQPLVIANIPQSALSDLFAEYDCSSLEIGLVGFRASPSMSPLGWHFADCESEQVMIAEDGTISLFDEGILRLECAKDGTAFLSGLAEFVAVRRQASEWEGRTSQAAKRCAAAAGGEQYIDFYAMLCSFLH